MASGSASSVGQLLRGAKHCYHIEGVLGHGAISEVLLARIANSVTMADDTGEEVAIKVLKHKTFIGKKSGSLKGDKQTRTYWICCHTQVIRITSTSSKSKLS